MLAMRRFFLAFFVASAALMLLPAMAAAQELELGTTSSKLVAPACPKNVSAANCTIILTRATALETLRDGVAYPSTVKTAGRIVAFTVGPVAAQHQREYDQAGHPLPRQHVRGNHPGGGRGAQAGRSQEPAALAAGGPEPTRARAAVARQGRPLPARQEPARDAGRDRRADDAHVGAGPLDRPLRQAVRLPPEPHQRMLLATLEQRRPVGRAEHPVSVQLPGNPGRILRHRGHVSGLLQLGHLVGLSRVAPR